MPITTTPSGGPQGEFSTYTPISAQTLTGNTASVTFSNIPTTFTDLVVVCSNLTNTTANTLCLRFNSDNGSNYSWNTSSASPYGTSALKTSGDSRGVALGGYVEGLNATTPGLYVGQVMNYSNSTTYKTCIARGSNTVTDIEIIAGLWRNTAPITSVTVIPSGGNMKSGTVLTIYGIKAAAPAPKATGGDLVYTDNTYWYHVFNNSGVFDVKTSMNVDYLVVAGGGGGGSGSGGGGGAGGYRTSIGGSTLSVSPVAYAITVGAGGAGSTGFAGGVGSGAKSGSSSTFSSISSTGGGLGGTYSTTASIRNGGSGGSGGGGSGIASASTGGSGNAGSYSPVEGYAGYQGNQSNNTGGGGGGASAAAVGINGANGTSNSISGSSVTYAGGGGGGSADNVTTTGGSGGGGAGNAVAVGNNGTTNLGGGGAGGGYNGSTAQTYNGGSGGSGVVIVRYAV